MAKCVVLGVTGGIAAYKAAELTSRLVKRGIDVRVIMTAHATEFITPLTFETLSSHPVAVDMFKRTAFWEEEHIALAKRADVFCIAPATANFLGKMAGGVADDMLTTTVLATTVPVLAAPAMHTAMYLHPATQRNIMTLKGWGWHFVEPDSGRLASGDIGPGRLAEPARIEAAILQLLEPKRDLEGLKVLVTAGPTREAVDPVRYLTNRSSGRMGYAIAEAAAARGAQVRLISGPVNLPVPSGVMRVGVEDAGEMLTACLTAFPGVDVAIKAAAPSDYRPASLAEHKIKKQGENLTLNLRENPDIAAAPLGGIKRGDQTLVIFAAETQDLLENARGKLERKNADLVVANRVGGETGGFEAPTNAATLLDRQGERVELPLMDKLEMAHRILDEVIALRKRGM